MDLATSQRAGVTIASVSQLAINYDDLEQLQEKLFAIIDGASEQLVVDLSSVASMDSFGVGVLMSAYRRMAKKDGIMTLAAVTERVRSALAITKVDSVIGIFATVDEACASFSEA